MTTYPADFPCASRIEGHSQAMSAGLIRTPVEAGVTRQRRSHTALPMRISLVFMVEQATYHAWMAWLNAHAWDDWVSMKLPGLLASRLGTDTAEIPVRFISDPQADLVPVHRLWWWRVRVDAEYLPTPEQLRPVPFGDWIVAGRPGNPSPDWIVAGTPPAPSSPGLVVAGRPLAPSAYA